VFEAVLGTSVHSQGIVHAGLPASLEAVVPAVDSDVMGKIFRPWEVDQTWLFPPSVKDLVPPDHLSHFVRDLVREELDLSAIFED